MKDNGFENVLNMIIQVTFIRKNIEDINEQEIPKVDTLISEPLGIMLINERMLEGFIIARNK